MMYLYCAILLQCFLACAQEENFLKANQRYTQGQYQEAALLYEGINNKGSAVWHNLGNCYWYLDRYKDAFFAYKKALKDAFYVDRNMLMHQKAQSYECWTGQKEPTPSMHDKIGTFVDFFSVFQWQCVCLLMWVLFLFSLRFLSRTMRGKIVTILLSIIMGMLFYVVYCAHKQNCPKGTIINAAKLFVAPRSDVHWLKEVTAGEDVILIDVNKHWTKVNAQGAIGWISNVDYQQDFHSTSN